MHKTGHSRWTVRCWLQNVQTLLMVFQKVFKGLLWKWVLLCKNPLSTYIGVELIFKMSTEKLFFFSADECENNLQVLMSVHTVHHSAQCKWSYGCSTSLLSSCMVSLAQAVIILPQYTLLDLSGRKTSDFGYCVSNNHTSPTHYECNINWISKLTLICSTVIKLMQKFWMIYSS